MQNAMILNPSLPKPDAAAVFGAALSLWKACWQEVAKDPHLNLSEVYQGGDEFMRQVMRVASVFETWSDEHMNFEQLDDVWPYLLEDKFGDVCMEVIGPSGLAEFDSIDCLRVAMRMRLPVRAVAGLSVPVDLNAENPVPGSPFGSFQIRSVRRHAEDDDIHQYLTEDDPDDPEFGPVFYGLYGLESDGIAEHIADRESYAGALALALKLVPGIPFPAEPTLRDSFSERD